MRWRWLRGWIVFNLFWGFRVSGVGDAGVVDGFEFVFECCFCGFDVLERDGAMGEEAVGCLLVYDVVDECVDAFFCVVGEAAGCCFHCVAHH